MPSPHDVVCVCGHWLDQHRKPDGVCDTCSCPKFEHDIEATREGLAESRDGLVVIQRLTAPQLRARRVSAMQELRRAEWAFDKRPTMANATACAALRSSISAAEMQLASLVEVEA